MAEAPARRYCIAWSRMMDPSQAHNGDLHHPSGLIDHGDAHWEDGWARESGNLVGDVGLFGAGIDGHSPEGIDQGKAVGTGTLGRQCNFGDIRDVGRELDDQWSISALPQLLGNEGHHLGAGPKGHSPFFNVGAGDVDFVAPDAGGSF
jgi:hypothetical protein